MLKGCENCVTTKVIGDARFIQSNAVNIPSGECVKCTITMFKEEIYCVGKTYQLSRMDWKLAISAMNTKFAMCER